MADLDDLFGSIRSAAQQSPVGPAEDVRRRGERRTRNGRVLLATTALALVAGTGTLLLTSGADGTDSLRPPQLAATPTGTPEPGLSLSPDPTPAPTTAVTPSTPTATSAPASTRPPSAPAAVAPSLGVDLVRTSPDGAAQVTWTARVTGRLPQLYDAQTGAAAGSPDQLLSVSWDNGDGTTGGGDSGAVECRAGAPLRTTSATFSQGLEADGSAKTYAPGTYTVRLTATGCGAGATGATTATDSITFTVDGPTGAPAAPEPGLSVALQRTSPDGAAQVTWTASVTGSAYTACCRDQAGQLLHARVDLGDGTVVDPPATGGCRVGSTLVPVDEQVAQPLGADGAPHTYAPGTYTVTVTVRACGPGAESGLDATGSLTFTVV